jgi:hypothetical protein
MYSYDTLSLHHSDNYAPSTRSYSPANPSVFSCSPSSEGDVSLSDFGESNPLAGPAIFSDQDNGVIWDVGMAFSTPTQQPFEQTLPPTDPKQFDSQADPYLHLASLDTYFRPGLYGISPYSSTSSLPSVSSQTSHVGFSPCSTGQFANIDSSPIPDSSTLSDNATRIPAQHSRFGAYNNLRGRLLALGRTGGRRLQTLREGVELNTEPPSGSSSHVVKQQVTSKATKAASAKRRRTEPKHFCSFCHESFTTKHNLKNHVNSHAGIRAHKCTHLGCGKYFNTKSDRKRHERIHEKENILFTAAHFTTRLNPF